MQPDIEGIRKLFEEMLGELKANYLQGYTNSATGDVHPAGLNRWKRDDNYYRGEFAKLLGPTPALEKLPEITVTSPATENRGGYGRIGDGPVEKLCYCCGRLSSEHTTAADGKSTCPPQERMP